MKYLIKCPVCKSGNIRRLFDLDKRVVQGMFSVVRCEDCGIAWTSPLPEKSEIAGFYPLSYHGESGEERFLSIVEVLVRLSRRKRAKEISMFNSGKPGRILDIGCGRGWMLSFLKNKGWETCGTELSLESSYFAREHLKLTVFPNEVKECSFPSRHFDVVTLWHTLEHLPQPVSTMQEAGRILKDNGLMIIEVPDFGGIQAQMFGNKWFHLDSPRHLYHFDRASLTRHLDETGFKVIKLQNLSWEYDIFGFIQSTLNIFCHKFDFLYNLLRDKKGKILKEGHLASARDLFLTTVLLPVLITAAIPAAAISSIIGRGSTIRVYCRKT